MKIYGVYDCTKYEGGFLQEPVYMHLKDAVEAAEKMVKEKQKEVEEMQEFTKDNSPGAGYKDWIKKEDYIWQGGYDYGCSVEIHTIELKK